MITRKLAALLVLVMVSPIYSIAEYCQSCERDNNGRIKRSQLAKYEFRHDHPCPSTGKAYGSCPGYVIDHVIPLKRGGVDDKSNMQWQTKEESKLKDKWE